MSDQQESQSQGVINVSVIGARRRLDLRLQAGDGNALDNDVPPLGNGSMASEFLEFAESSNVTSLGECPGLRKNYNLSQFLESG